MTIDTQHPLLTVAERLVALASDLAEHAAGDRESAGETAPGETALGETPQITSAEMLQMRKIRAEFLPSTLFHEPAWDILLALHSHPDDREPLSLKDVAREASVPFTTIQRWVDYMAKAQLIRRVECSSDRRRIELYLTSECRERIDAYVAHAARSLHMAA